MCSDEAPEIAEIAESPPDTLSPPAKKGRITIIKDRETPRSHILVLTILLSWHPTKNGDVDPRFAPDHARFWWACLCKSSKCLDTCTHSHDYQASISNRFTKDGDTKQGCPWCSGTGIVLCPCQSLESRFPYLAKEWYQPLNGDLLHTSLSRIKSSSVLDLST